MNRVNLDFVGHGKGQGKVAGRLMTQGINPDKMRPYYKEKEDGSYGAYISMYTGGKIDDPKNYKEIEVNDATLRKDEWKQLDTALIGVAESRLNGVQDLINKGLTFNVNGFGTTVLESEAISDAMEAELSMNGERRGKGDRQEFSTTYLPLPIIHVDYDINERTLQASRNLGNGLDVTQVERAGRRVAEKLESMLFTDTSYTRFGGTIYSYINYPDRNQISLGTNWDESGVTGEDIITDVLSMKQALLDAHFYGPFVLYIPANYETKLDEDYDNTRGNTIRQRIAAISLISEIKVIDTLPSDNVLMVQMTSDVVRLVRGLGITNVEWSSEGGMSHHYKVMTIQVPQIRSDYNGACGIAHLA